MPEPGRPGTPTSPATRAEDADWFRRVLGHYPTGVSVVTGIGADGVPVGLAVGSFTSVSLDPPLVGFLPSTQSSSWPKIRKARKFCVNILAADQEPVCRTFASKTRDKFAGLDWRPAASGSPILEGVVAWIDCDLEAVHEAGDHLIVIGRVSDLHIERPTLPLLFFQGGYGKFSTHSLAVGDPRFGLQLQLLDGARPLMEALAERTSAQAVAAHCDGSELTLLATAGVPTDPRVPSAAIGQRLPVIPPIGIWWMAFAKATQVDEWLRDVERPDLRARYRHALGQIRELGYCLGLANVQAEITGIINSRSGPDGEPTPEERQSISRLTLDPLDYVPSGDSLGTSGRPAQDVVSLWAPTFTPQGEIALGLMLTGFPRGERPPQSYADDLLELARDVTTLAGA